MSTSPRRGCRAALTRIGTVVAGALALMVLMATPAVAGGVRIVAEQRLAPRVVKLTITTPAFAVPTHVDVDLPSGYDSEPHRRWPVTYVLAGTMNTYTTFNDFVDGVELTKSYPSIVVSPNGDSGYWSDWYNNGAFGPPMYETYVIDQLIPLIDHHFRTIPRRSQRAVLGISMGGDGAMMLAAEHPDLFADAATLDGAVDSNLPYIAAAIAVSPEFQGAPANSIYGPQATQDIRWHGHNPVDLANNLRGLDLQVRTANGVPDPGIGENPLSADTVSCVIELGVYSASIDLNNTLNELGIPHLWHDYGPGCHTKANFERGLRDTFAVFQGDFAHPPAAPATFNYTSIEPSFTVWGWHVVADPRRALEFLSMEKAGPGGLTLVGSGMTTVTSPPLFRGLRRVALSGARRALAVPSHGRIRFTVDLGAPDTQQEDTPGAMTNRISRNVTIAPYAVVRITRLLVHHSGVRVCLRALGGIVTARLRLLGMGRRPIAHSRRLILRERTTCRVLGWTRRAPGTALTLLVTGRDGFGHAVRAHRTIRGWRHPARRP